MKNKLLYLALGLLSVSLLFSPNAFSRSGLEMHSVHSGGKMNRTVWIGETFSIHAKVVNEGKTKSSRTKLRFYRSTDRQINTSDVQVGERTVPPLMPGQFSKVMSVQLSQPDPDVYHYGACVDVGPGQTRCAISVVTITVKKDPRSGLQVQSVSADKSTVAPGGTFTLSATVANKGTTPSTSTFLQFYRSGNKKITRNDKKVQLVEVGGLGLPTGSWNKTTESITVKAPTNAGTYYYGACVYRGGSNWHCSKAVKITVKENPQLKPSLEVESVWVDKSTVPSGGSFTLFATVANKGTAESTSTTLQFYQLSPTTTTVPGIPIGDALTVPDLGLPTGDWNKTTVSIPVTALQTPGTYHYKACVDRGGGTSDCSTAVSITVTAGPYLALPSDVISEVAFGPKSTYFVLTGQFPELKGVSNAADVFYKEAVTMIGIPENTELFWAPMEKKTDKGWLGLGVNIGVDLAVTKIGCKVGVMIGAALGTPAAGVGAVPGAGIGCAIGATLAPIIYITGKFFWDTHQEKKEHEKFFGAPLIEMKNKGNEPGLPSDSNYRIFVLIHRRLEKIEVGMGLEYQPRRYNWSWVDGNQRKKIEVTETLNLKDIAAAAPSACPISLADYPPFQMLPIEVQEYLHQHHFGEFGHAGAWQAPEQTSLLANYPNPFNPETWIPYQLAQPSDVTVRIYDMQGHLVRELALGHQRAGVYRDRSRAAYWDGRNTHGEPVASGVYFYTLTASNFSATRKMLIRK